VITLLALSGSLRAASSNAALLEAARLLAPPGIAVVTYGGLGALPHFNPDLDREPLPPAVADLRRHIGAVDGLLISCPEYARGIPGAFKNALDWLVSGFEMPGKPVALFNASPRASEAHAALRLVLRTVAARLVEEASITLPLLAKDMDARASAANVELGRTAHELAEAQRHVGRDGPLARERSVQRLPAVNLASTHRDERQMPAASLRDIPPSQPSSILRLPIARVRAIP
jgi:chromate reductase, NAD(P)H dehydrogenase (quinone)